ncbi:MAG TPA: redox-sensing transcriptional repressor Rex, partial [Thermoanaerobacterales bacterium]|nr:redox-sensing transcriptional repressor Rex [Thermoanaerobacterales bacterium]
TIISSTEMANKIGITPAQVRRDLAYFGEFGTRGVGYNVKDLKENIIKILGLNRRWKVALIGAGNLASALTNYKGFYERGFDIVAIFDNDPNKIGKMISDRTILDFEKDLGNTIDELDIELAIVAVTASNAQEVVDSLVEAGITGIVNFAPTSISAPKDVIIRRVDLASQLEVLTFNIENRKQDRYQL